jgi:acetoacetyl-CoA synthetase
VFGTSPQIPRHPGKQRRPNPKQSHDLGSLKTLLCTGSALSPQSYDYVYRDLKTDLCLASMSGGTDIVSCFINGNPLVPVRRGEMQGKSLGMAVEVWKRRGPAGHRQKG